MKRIIGIGMICAGLAGALEVQLPSGASAALQHASGELQEYAGKLTGQSAPAGAFVLKVDRGLPAEKWVIQSAGESVTLTGGSDAGVLYAVHHYLEDCCGVRWWSAWEDTVPHLSSLPLKGLSLSGMPAFMMRDIWYLHANDKGRFESRLRLNGQMAYDKLILPEWGGFRLFGPPHICHTFSMYIQPEVYFKDHPEWFALLNGKRQALIPNGKTMVPTQLCLTNQAMRAEFLKLLKANIQKSYAEADGKGVPRPRVFDVSQNDTNQTFCQCQACRALEQREGSLAGPLLEFVNWLAERIQKEYPEVLISTLIYHETEALPRTVRPASNVLIVLCDTLTNSVFPVGAPGNEYFAKLLTDWSKYARHIRLWDYNVCYPVGDEPCEPPYASEYNYPFDLKFFLQHRVEQYFCELEYPLYSDVREYKIWMLAKLLEDPNRDFRKLSETFAQGYYGPAAPQFLEYRALLKQSAEVMCPHIDMHTSQALLTHLNLATVQQSQALFDQGEKLLQGQPVLLERWASARLSLDRFTVFLRRQLMKEYYEKNGTLKGFPIDFAPIAARAKATLAARELHYPVQWPLKKTERDAAYSQLDKALKSRVTERSFQVPAQFKDIPADRYFGLTCDEGQLWYLPQLVDDPTSYCGRAAAIELKGQGKDTTIEKYRLPQPFGIYSGMLKKNLLRTDLTAKQIAGPGWHWYKIGTTKLVPDANVFCFWSWYVQMSLRQVYDPQHPEAQYDVWVCLKLTGPDYPFPQPGDTVDTLWIAGFVAVRR